jgi:pantoate--beta-alanine ligase
VNPARCESDEDFSAYPRTPEEDAELAEREGADILFTPAQDTMYSPRAQTAVQVYGLTQGLCGMTRGQGYFLGATTVAAKLFNIVRPTRAYFSQKNAQLALAVQRMVLDLHFPVEIAIRPTVREKDGLAAHALNAAIPPAFRPAALLLREALVLGRGLLRDGQDDAFALANSMQEHILKDPHVELDYLEIVSPETLEPVEKVDDLVLMAAAATVAGVRLTDNILAGPDGGDFDKAED